MLKSNWIAVGKGREEFTSKPANDPSVDFNPLRLIGSFESSALIIKLSLLSLSLIRCPLLLLSADKSDEGDKSRGVCVVAQNISALRKLLRFDDFLMVI